ncbi:MAG TPA: anthranilate phosphoribosyltransferase [Acidimicrobiia bacterium]|nr:anthranilate phosphoribosyltransferase [Acidimicrobiia bacterium]
MTDAHAILSDALARLLRGEELPAEVAQRALGSILSGEATDAQIAGFAVALRAKGETPAELAALVRTMLLFSDRVEVSDGTALIDTCGTGGDRSGTVNVSTMAALVAAGAGARVAKHGNRAQSSNCGSADVLEALGVVIDLGPPGVARCIEEAGIGFCLAPRYHPALRFAAVPRRELGVPTTFNFLGPLANPAGVRRQSLGVSDSTMAERVVAALRELGSEHALVFYGHDGLDELTTTGPSTVFELRDGEVRRFEVDLAGLGIRQVDHDELKGGDAATNADIVRRVVAGEPGAVRDIVLLNAAAALIVAGLAPDLAGGLELAAAVVDDGRAAASLDAFVRVSGAARLAED